MFTVALSVASSCTVKLRVPGVTVAVGGLPLPSASKFAVTVQSVVTAAVV